MAGLSTLAAASGAVQGLQQGTQNAEDTKRFLASLLQQQKQFDVTSGLESRRVGALEKETGASVKQMGAETDIKKAKLQDIKLEYTLRKTIVSELLDKDIPAKEVDAIASEIVSKGLETQTNILTQREAFKFLEQDPELARDIGLAQPRQQVAAARTAEAGATGQELTTGALPTTIENQQESARIAIDAGRFKLDSAKSMFPLQSTEARLRNRALEQSIENMIVQHDNMIKSGLFTEAQTVAQNIENATADVLANAQAANIAARTGLTEAQTSAIATELAQADKRLSLLDKQLRLQYPQVDDTQNALTPSERNNINSEINRLRAELVAASLDRNQPLIKSNKRQLELQYARLGYTPIFTDVEQVKRLRKDVQVTDVSNLIPFGSDTAIIPSPRVNGGDTGGTTGEGTVNARARVKQLMREGEWNQAISFGDANNVDEAERQIIEGELVKERQ